MVSRDKNTNGNTKYKYIKIQWKYKIYKNIIEIQNIPFKKSLGEPEQRVVFAEGTLLFPFQTENF